jgi:hypothetical protein
MAALGSIGDIGDAFEMVYQTFAEDGDDNDLAAIRRMIKASDAAMARVLAPADADECYASMSILDDAEFANDSLRELALSLLPDPDYRSCAANVLLAHFVDDAAAMAALEAARKEAGPDEDAESVPESFERGGRSLKEWIIALTDECQREAAWRAIAAMVWSVTDIADDLEDMPDIEAEEGALAAEVARVFALPEVDAAAIGAIAMHDYEAMSSEWSLDMEADASGIGWTLSSACELLVENIGPAGAPLIPELLSWCDHQMRSLPATRALGSMGAAAAPAVDRLLVYAEANWNQEWPDRWQEALVRIAAADSASCDKLVACFDEPEATSKVAASVLAKLGERALPALSAIE